MGGCAAPAARTQWGLPTGAAHSFGAGTGSLVDGSDCDAPADSLPTAATLADWNPLDLTHLRTLARHAWLRVSTLTMRVCWSRRSAGGKPRGLGHGDDAAVDTGADRSIRPRPRELVSS